MNRVGPLLCSHRHFARIPPAAPTSERRWAAWQPPLDTSSIQRPHPAGMGQPAPIRRLPSRSRPPALARAGAEEPLGRGENPAPSTSAHGRENWGARARPASGRVCRPLSGTNRSKVQVGSSPVRLRTSAAWPAADASAGGDRHTREGWTPGQCDPPGSHWPVAIGNLRPWSAVMAPRKSRICARHSGQTCSRRRSEQLVLFPR